jgi:hypothetical protein
MREVDENLWGSDHNSPLDRLDRQAQTIRAAEQRSDQQSASRHRLTHAESVDRAQLLALFDQLDSRGQKTTLAMLAVAVKLHPRS